MTTIALPTLTDRIAAELRITSLPDYPGAMNGLQLQNRSGQIVRLLAAVDASLPVLRNAAALSGPSLLLVHHGFFWKGAQMITGAWFEKIRAAMESDLAVYSAHLPLDVHPELGNNACLAAALGMAPTVPFFDWKGMPLGLRARVDISREALAARLSEAVAGQSTSVRAGRSRSGKSASSLAEPARKSALSLLQEWIPSSPERARIGAIQPPKKLASTSSTAATMPPRPSA